MKNITQNNLFYDLLGIGIGPFNLGLAALTEPIGQINSIFLEQNNMFNWHPGLLIDTAKLQVPYLADMVTLADPTSRYSFLNYLKEHNRLYKFYFYENFFILRQEYNHYCQWVSTQLSNVQFKTKVIDINLDTTNNSGFYKVKTMNTLTNETSTIHARHIALGVGTSPHTPPTLAFPETPYIFHAANYLTSKALLDDTKIICIIGSGQSAAEIVLDLLTQQPNCQRRLIWITRSSGFFPMEYSKLGLEHFSPDYMNLFYNLDVDIRKKLIAKHDLLYKGISKETIAEIFDLLYRLTVANQDQPLTMISNTEVNSITMTNTAAHFNVNSKHNLTKEAFSINCDAVILATGYTSSDMKLLEPLDNILIKDPNQSYILNPDFSIKNNSNSLGKIFMQNNSMLSHGVGSPDLGLGCHRNSVIINTILGNNFYKIETKNVFQTFNSTVLGDY